MPYERLDADEFARFQKGILKLWGIDLGNYGERQLHRRLSFMMGRAGDANLDDFLHHLAEDRDLSERLRNQFTINVSEFFRDAHLFARLEAMLRAGGICHAAEKLWSAGCSYGAEPYSLAMLMAENSPHGNWHISATDIDKEALGRARQGVFSERDLRNVSLTRRRRFFTARDGDRYAIASKLQCRVSFTELDLLKPKASVPTDCDVVLCRNVIIYFTAEAKRQVHELLTQALRPGGVLLIGATERVPEAMNLGLKSISPFFYTRQKAA